jgi:hypothetical protein
MQVRFVSGSGLGTACSKLTRWAKAAVNGASRYFAFVPNNHVLCTEERSGNSQLIVWRRQLASRYCALR